MTGPHRTGPSGDSDTAPDTAPGTAPGTAPEVAPAALALPPEPATRRVHQYGILIGLGVLVIVCTVWLLWSYFTTADQAQESRAAATTLCRQLIKVNQPCATLPPGQDGVAADAVMPAPTASLTGSPVAPRRQPGAPLPTDEQGIPQAFQPGPDALIVSVTVNEGRLILSYDDGARVDAGPVDEDTLAIVLRASPSVSPSPSPSPVETSPAGDPASPSDTPSPTGEATTPQETP